MVRIPDDESFGGMKRDRAEMSRRVDDLERPDGSQIIGVWERIKALVAGIDATVQAAIAAYSYTRAQIDAKRWGADRIDGVLAPANGGSGTTNAALNTFTSGGPWNIVYAKESSGELGHAPSSARFKRDVQDAWPGAQPASLSAVDADPMRVLDFPVQAFRYIDDVDERGDEAYWHYGFIAEQLAAACLDPLLIFDADGDVLGLAYERLPLLHHEVLRRVNATNRDLVWRVGELERERDQARTDIDDLTQRLTLLEERGT